jgi:dUTP pyrophosphatase
MKIKVKLFDGQVMPEIIDKGDWIDLRANKDFEPLRPNASVLEKETYIMRGEVKLRSVRFEYAEMPLGIAMKLPAGFEAIVAPRSSLCKKHGVICANSIGIIDNTYCGNEDEWKMPLLGVGRGLEGPIFAGTRIAQFRIQLSQKATFWQKLRWFFSSKIKFEFVEELNDNNRGGIGSTGSN